MKMTRYRRVSNRAEMDVTGPRAHDPTPKQSGSSRQAQLYATVRARLSDDADCECGASGRRMTLKILLVISPTDDYSREIRLITTIRSR